MNIFFKDEIKIIRRSNIFSPYPSGWSCSLSGIHKSHELGDGYIFFDSHFHSFRRGKGREEKVTGRTGVAERGGDRTLSGPEAGVWAHIQTHRDPTTPSPAGPGRLSQETSWKMASYQATWVPG